MQFADVVANRRMVRAFETSPVPSDVLDRILDLARRVPAAGNTQGLDLVVLEGEQTQRYWDASLPTDRRAAFPWPRLLDAPVLIIPVSWPAAYVERYGEHDKARTGLGESEESWSVPYWYVDTAFSAMVAIRTRRRSEKRAWHPRGSPADRNDRDWLRRRRAAAKRIIETAASTL